MNASDRHSWAPAGATRSLALFTVPDVIGTESVLLDFVRFWYRRSRSEAAAAASAAAIVAESGRGTCAAAVNRMCFAMLAGAFHDELRAAAHEWYPRYRSRCEAFPAAARSAIGRRIGSGDLVAVVSGAFRPCLELLAAEAGVRTVLCADPLMDAQGRLTGEVARPMVGPAKADAASALAAANRVDMRECRAYGTTSDDLALLCAVGRPLVIGGNAFLAEQARARSWPVATRGDVDMPGHNVA